MDYRLYIYHTRCRRKPADGTFTPTRLVYIGMSGVRIVESSLQQIPVAYLTLSYCWGKGVPMRLLKRNFTAMSKLLPLSDLPETFRDAFKVTRHLGHRYIYGSTLYVLSKMITMIGNESLLPWATSTLGASSTSAPQVRLTAHKAFSGSVTRFRCIILKLHSQTRSCVKTDRISHSRTTCGILGTVKKL